MTQRSRQTLVAHTHTGKGHGPAPPLSQGRRKKKPTRRILTERVVCLSSPSRVGPPPLTFRKKACPVPKSLPKTNRRSHLQSTMCRLGAMLRRSASPQPAPSAAASAASGTNQKQQAAAAAAGGGGPSASLTPTTSSSAKPAERPPNSAVMALHLDSSGLNGAAWQPKSTRRERAPVTKFEPVMEPVVKRRKREEAEGTEGREGEGAAAAAAGGGGGGGGGDDNTEAEEEEEEEVHDAGACHASVLVWGFGLGRIR
jgi:hypothetical protein